MTDPKPYQKSSDAQKRTTWQTVLNELKKDIVYGRLQPKEHLFEDELMHRFGVSRYAVRRSLEELQSLGLAVRTENRGTRIRSYSPQEVLDLYELREILEREAAKLIPLPASDELVQELTRIQNNYDSAATNEIWHEIHMCNDEFHRTLFSACPNKLIADQINSYALQVQPVRIRFVLDEDHRRQAGRDHWEIIDAIRQGDGQRLVDVCANHISQGREVYAKSTVIESMDLNVNSVR